MQQRVQGWSSNVTRWFFLKAPPQESTDVSAGNSRGEVEDSNQARHLPTSSRAVEPSVPTTSLEILLPACRFAREPVYTYGKYLRDSNNRTRGTRRLCCGSRPIKVVQELQLLCWGNSAELSSNIHLN